MDFLFKPIVPEVLRSKVAVFVELSRTNAKLKEQTEALRKQAEILQKAEQRFRSLLEAAPDAMLVCTGKTARDRDGKFPRPKSCSTASATS